MRLWLTIIGLALLVLLAARRGGKPEQIVAYSFAVALALDLLSRFLLGPSKFLAFEPVQFGIEVGLLVVLLYLSIRANRWWPLCASALQVIVVSMHLAKLVGGEGLAGIYWALTTIPTYLQFFVLLLGIRSHALRVARIGHCRDWRIP